MKRTSTAAILSTAFTFATVTATLLAADTDPLVQKKSSASGRVNAASSDSTGKATVTIEVNGKKETREVELGNGTSITVVSDENKPANSGRKSWLGVASDELSDEVRAQLPVEPGTGLLVRAVVEKSPAAEAGLLKNDVLFKFDDQILANAAQLKTLVGTKKEGDNVHLTYFRKGQQAVLDAKIGTHEGGDLDSPQFKLGELLPGMGRGFEWIKNLSAPIGLHSRSVILDKKGNVLTENREAELDAVISKLETTLREAGVDKAVIEQARRAVAETSEAVQKGADNADKIREQISREVKKAFEQANKALEQSRAADPSRPAESVK